MECIYRQFKFIVLDLKRIRMADPVGGTNPAMPTI